MPRAEQDDVFVGRDQIADDVGITTNDTYATGLLMVGTTNELMGRMHQRLELHGLIRTNDPKTLENGAQTADYFVEGASV